MKKSNCLQLILLLGRRANLPIYEARVSLLEAAPGIKLEHVKAHEDPKKQSTWTRAQWGNFYADTLAKGDNEHWNTEARNIGNDPYPMALDFKEQTPTS